VLAWRRWRQRYVHNNGNVRILGQVFSVSRHRGGSPVCIRHPRPEPRPARVDDLASFARSLNNRPRKALAYINHQRSSPSSLRTGSAEPSAITSTET